MQQSVAEWFQENQCSQITHDPSADCFIKKVYLRRMRYLECYPELKDLFEQEYQARLVPPWYPNRSPPEFLTKDSVVPMAKNDAVGSSSSQQACSLSFVLVSRLVSGPGDACLNCCLAQLLWKIESQLCQEPSDSSTSSPSTSEASSPFECLLKTQYSYRCCFA